MRVETMKVKADTAKGYRVINSSDYDPKVHQAYEGSAPEDKQTDAEREASEKLAAERKAQANFGQVDGNHLSAENMAKNPSGTYSEPTPTDIRYPDKTATEFENNFGAHIGKSAAGLRKELDLDDAPGGLKPEVHEKVAADQAHADHEAARARKAAREEADALISAKGKASADSDLDNMTVADLRERAASQGVDLGDATKKADIIAAIKAR